MKFLPLEYAVRNQGRAPLRACLQLLGSVLMSLLVLAAGAFVVGLDESLSVSASPNNAILLGAGSEESLERSQIDVRTGSIAAASIPGIRTIAGMSLVSPEVHAALQVQPAPNEEGKALVVLRGITPPAFLVHRELRMVRGRAPQAGTNEVIVGRLVAAKLGWEPTRLEMGKQIWIDDQAWEIVGHFEAPGSVIEGELWCPLTDLQVLTQRNTLSCVVITMDRAEDFPEVDLFATSRLDLEVAAMRETEYFDSLSEFFAPIRWMVWATAVLVGFGGVLGGLNVLYAGFASRIREFATLQVLGFSRVAIFVALLQESVFVAAVGSLIGVGLGYLFLDGLAVSFSMGVFGLAINGVVVGMALSAGLFIGAVGAVPPALRCLLPTLPVSLKS